MSSEIEIRREFRIFNSMSKQKEVFKPKLPGKASLYVCGVTSYALSHIGHARAYVAFDILFRYLKHRGYEVTYVRNFTDIDDKIIAEAKKNGEDPLSFSDRYCQEFMTDMADLQCLPPNEQPRVSDHINQIKDMIQKIISNDCGYVVEGGDVNFSVDKSPNYGRLSGRDVDANKPNHIDPRKRNQSDFAMWKAAKQDEISWDSPWGPGRPGWHIECSAMSATYLTESFDIHGGGIDLMSQMHHDNEIAQSFAACPNSNISYWMHNGHVKINDEKMSKSSGNFFTIREVTEVYHPLALRHYLLRTHYRSPLNYSIDQIDISSNAVYKIDQTLEDCENAIKQSLQVTETSGHSITNDAQNCINNLKSHFEEKLADDLHTTSILNEALQDALSLLNTILPMLKKKLQQPQRLSYTNSIIELVKEVIYVLEVLGLHSNLTYTEVLKQLKKKALKRAGLAEEQILELIQERALAKKQRDFKLSDRIRNDLSSMGIALMDDGNITRWRPIVPVDYVEPTS